MNALLLPLSFRTPAASNAGDIRLDISRDLPDARIWLIADDALVPAWYLDTKPRRDATVIPLGRGCWAYGAPTATAMKRARLLLETGVSVLLVDARACDGWWARLLGRSRTGLLRAGLDYLAERGHDEDACTVDAF
ncbi:MAG: hypothetical protein ABI624_19825 [Casimicrobiaceae bacterium]